MNRLRMKFGSKNAEIELDETANLHQYDMQFFLTSIILVHTVDSVHMFICLRATACSNSLITSLDNGSLGHHFFPLLLIFKCIINLHRISDF